MGEVSAYDERWRKAGNVSMLGITGHTPLLDTKAGKSWASVQPARAYSSSVDEFNRLGSLASVVIIAAVLAMATILAFLVRAVVLAAG